MLTPFHPRRNESGVALLTAIATMVVAALVIAGISTSLFTTRDRARDEVDQTLGAGPAEDGVRAYVDALSGGLVGEHTAFVFTKEALEKSISDDKGGGGYCEKASDKLCLLRNSDERVAFPLVDDRLIPEEDQLTVRRRISNGNYRYWQVLAVAAPRYGVVEQGQVSSPGGAAVVYIRGWQGGERPLVNNVVRPVVLRGEVRPAVYSDYQLLTDGKIYLGGSAAEPFVIDGRIHTNGLEQSFFDQYKRLEHAITVDGAECSGSATLTTADGSIGGPDKLNPAEPAPFVGTCNDDSKLFPGEGENLSLLRSVESARFAGSLCGRKAPVEVTCFDAPAGVESGYQVTLNGNGTASVTGPRSGSVDAKNKRLKFLQTTGQFGAVMIFDRSVEVRGQLGQGSRLTIFAINTESEPVSETPSIRLVSLNAGASPDSTSSVGFVAEGDVVAAGPETDPTACPEQVRAAVVAQGGMFSMEPRFRGAAIPGAPLCKGALQFNGSISAHLPQYLTVVTFDSNQVPVPHSGYPRKTISYDQWLYHNPPPLFPASQRWQLLTTTTADLACFYDEAASGKSGVARQAPRLHDRFGCR